MGGGGVDSHTSAGVSSRTPPKQGCCEAHKQQPASTLRVSSGGAGELKTTTTITTFAPGPLAWVELSGQQCLALCNHA